MIIRIKNTEKNRRQVAKSQEEYAINGKYLDVKVSQHFENYFNSGQMTKKEYKNNILDLQEKLHP